MRRQVVLLAAISVAAPVALLGAALFSVLVPRSGRAPIYVALALLLGAGAARGVLSRRLVATEQAVVRFWGVAPTLTLLTASVLGALPVLVLDALEIHVGKTALCALVAALAVASGLVVCALWRRLRDSLAQGAPKSAA